MTTPCSTDVPLRPGDSTAPAHGPRFMPERWLLLGHSQAWLQAARQWLQQQAHTPGVLGWRVRHGLLQLATPDTLGAALRTALAGQPGLLSVLAEAGAFAAPQPGVDALIEGRWPPEFSDARSAVQVLIGQVDATLSGLGERLSLPDSEAAEHWLLSGRTLWPHLALPQPDPHFEAEALLAFQHWADGHLLRHPPAELDAIYGSASSHAERMASPWQDEELLADQPLGEPRLAPAGGNATPLHTGGPFSPRRAAAQGAVAAAAAGRQAALRGRIQGVFDVSDPLGPPDQYRLDCPGPIWPGREAGALTVTLTLCTARWQAQPHLVLEIHTDGQPVQLVHWQERPATPGGGATFTLTQQLDCSEAWRQALNCGVELWLAPGAGTPGTGGPGRRQPK